MALSFEEFIKEKKEKESHARKEKLLTGIVKGGMKLHDFWVDKEGQQKRLIRQHEEKASEKMQYEKYLESMGQATPVPETPLVYADQEGSGVSERVANIQAPIDTSTTQPISSDSANVQKQALESQKVLQSVLEKPKQMTHAITTNPENSKDVDTLIDAKIGEGSLNTKAKEVLKDPRKLASKQAEIEEKKENGKPLGILDQFIDAAGSFLPEALGMVVGGIFGGTEGAVAGYEKGQETSSLMRDIKQQQELMNLQKGKAIAKGAPQLQQTKLMDPTTGQPVYLKKYADGTSEHVDVNGNKVANTVDADQVAIDRRNIEKQTIARENRFLDKADTFSNRKDVAKIKNSIMEADHIRTLVDSDVKLTEAFISTNIAKGIQGQAGVLTDKDVARAGVPLDVATSLLSKTKEFFAGDMTDDKKQAIRVLIDKIQASEKLKIDKMASTYAGSKSLQKNLNKNKDEILSQLYSSMGMSGPSKVSPKLQSLKDRLKKGRK